MKTKLFCLLLVWCLCFGNMMVQRVQASDMPYLLDVNLTQNVVTVYAKDESGKYTKPVKAFLCSVGTATPEGTFTTSDKYTWRALYGNVYGQYATRIVDDILFHSVPYLEMYDKSSMEYQQYTRLGQSVSMGCIRMTVSSVKWIYDNCPSGTTVRMYHSDAPVPLTPEQPPQIDITDVNTRGWDPTDPDTNNPWHEIQQQSKMVPQEIQIVYQQYSTMISSVWQRGNYYISKETAEQIFSDIKKDIVLPSLLPSTDVKVGTVTIEHNEQTNTIAYIVYEQQLYFALRDLAIQANLNIVWNGEENQIILSDIQTPEHTEKKGIFARLYEKLGVPVQNGKPDFLGWLTSAFDFLDTEPSHDDTTEEDIFDHIAKWITSLFYE